MKRFCVLMVVFWLTALLPGVSQQGGEGGAASMTGYSPDSARTEREWETKFRAIPQAENVKENDRRLSARPHAVGQPYDKDNAEWILSQFKSWGVDAHIESFNVLFPTPKQRLVELVAPVQFTAKLEEPTVPEDPTSNQHAEQLPTYNAYSADGDVTAPLVFVNYGIPEDYDRLERMGISVKGAIVIAKYGNSWRGIKPKVAAEHGAVGCLIYSDPKDDGFVQGDVFPQGAWRPKDGVQRGSVEDMPTYPGDPLTPGVGATADAKRLPMSEVKVLTKIPVLPISYADATPLLEHLGGPVAPDTWRGGLGFTYHIGPGPAKVHLVVKANWDMKPVYDVIATFHGTTDADEWIVRGNHHDAWVNGAEDPLSGQSAMMEEVRGLAELSKQGWKPKRTIIYAAWDGEEPGLLGSTEWAETHQEELRQHGAVYVNSDSNSRGYLGVSGSHSLEHVMNEVAKDITDPESKVSVWKRNQMRRIEQAKTPEDKQKLRSTRDLQIGALGSGSDYTAFLDYIGMASMNIGFGGEAGGGIYHSIYDDFYWYTHFDDPQFIYGRALAQTGGTTMMRLADADVLPLDFTNEAATITRYVGELEKLAKDERDQIVETNRELDEGLFQATENPMQKELPPKREEVPPFLNFAPLHNGADAVTQAAQRYQKAYQAAVAALSKSSLATVDQQLIQSERALTSPQGLPNRPWFKHQIYAPGFYTGYGVKTIPAVREAIEQKDWQEANQQIVRVGQVLDNEAKVIDQAAQALEQATGGRSGGE